MVYTTARRSPVSSRAAVLQGSSLGELLLLARKRHAIDLAVGTPGYPEPSAGLLQAAADAMQAGRNQYDHPSGDLLLRKRIAETLAPGADPRTELTVTVGATEALCVALLATIDPGDEVVLLDPGYEQFRAAIALAGAVPRFVPLHPPAWRYDPTDLAAAFGPRTRAVLLNTPANPTGRVLDRTELDEIAALCDHWNATVICDEVYSTYVFDGRSWLSVSEVPGLTERSIVVGSLSKSHAISGWRLGFLRADAARTEVLRRVHEVTTNGAATPLQVAVGVAALSVDLCAATVQMAQCRDLVQEMFSRKGMKFAAPEGGCYLLADISPVTDGKYSGRQFVLELLDEAGVLLAPGASFFADSTRGEQYVRIAFNRQPDLLGEVERRILAG
ncbi:pyridoxal phosphate-dependent aminotransferase [Streptomyces sp. AK02-04a]|uniref:pyridoxal phosphate-dependent aminotransferase n=1 Tax=Streptomyces sp. AK02-04a TaxID=3028649 RepID=UPI0029BD6580|nr:pyridoxal phosphate-dependent aminotransferase [Streptomyces sp. AK02-04a]MDX3763693.1 pyridoxal phosphate-dependent aminotransferase [Streptomyces sp. AK02-04a]